MSDVQWLIDDFPEDCARIQRIAREHDRIVSVEECATAWHEFSQGVFANWLFLPPDDEKIWQLTFAPKVLTRVLSDGYSTKDGCS